MKKGCLVIIAVLSVLWIIGTITGGHNSSSTESGKVSYTCVWCQKIFVGDEGDLSCYYYDENYKGCGYHTVTQNTLTGFCTANHCELYRLASNSTGSNGVNGGKCSWCKIGTYVNGTCDRCGTISNERERELKGNSISRSRKIEECAYRSTHYKIQFPYTCDCGYVGK